MKLKIRNIMFVSAAVFGLCLLAYPFLSSNAQKVEKNSRLQNQTSALDSVMGKAVTKDFYGKLQQNEKNFQNNWDLTDASNIPKSSLTGGADVSIVRLMTGSEAVEIVFNEYDNSAKSVFSPLSQGRAESCKGNLCGDEGRKVYGGNGKFHHLEYIKDKFHITITCQSEKTALRFSDYVLQAIAEN